MVETIKAFSISRQNIPKLEFLVWKYTNWQPLWTGNYLFWKLSHTHPTPHDIKQSVAHKVGLKI
jgi:hypothetical protein